MSRLNVNVCLRIGDGCPLRIRPFSICSCHESQNYMQMIIRNFRYTCVFPWRTRELYVWILAINKAKKREEIRNIVIYMKLYLNGIYLIIYSSLSSRCILREKSRTSKKFENK